MKNKIKNKINAFKANTSRFQVLTLNDWLTIQGLQENAENRALYAQYRLNIDEKNKQQDMNLSKFIGTLTVVVVFLVFVVIALSQQVGATPMAYGDYAEIGVQEEYVQGAGHLESYVIPYNNGVNAYSLDISVIYKLFLPVSNIFVTVCTDNIEYLYNDITTNLESDISMLNDNDIYNYFLSAYNIDISLHMYDTYMTNDFISKLIRNYDIIRQTIYENARHQGYSEGYSVGFSVGSESGYNNGYEQGDINGYQNGYTDGVNEGETLKKGIFAIFDGPVNMLQSILNFEIMGINLYSIFTFIITLCLLAILTKTIFGLFN